MKSIQATCPKCDYLFCLDDALAKEINSLVAKKTSETLQKQEMEISKLKRNISEMEIQEKAKAQQFALAEVAKALKSQEAQLRDENKVALLSLTDELKRSNARLQETQAQELLLRKRASEVEERGREINIEVERKIAERLGDVKETLARQIADDFRRKDLERENLISDLRKQIVTMKHKAEEGSQQSQGEIFQDEFGALLKEAFPIDTIEEVARGANGADFIHSVVTRAGQRAGRILWEVKNTKSFQPAWIEKLKQERNDISADLAILVTTTMPKGKVHAYLDQGIWVVDTFVAVSLASVARQSLIEIHQVSLVSNSRHEKADILYNYLTNPIFRQRLETVVESFHQMREDLEREKRAISKTWKQRERHLDSVVENVVHIYGDIQGVVGQKILSIQRLEFPMIASSEVE